MYSRMRMVSCLSSISVVSNLDLDLRGCWRRFACRLARAVLANSYGYSLRAAHTMQHATHPPSSRVPREICGLKMGGQFFFRQLRPARIELMRGPSRPRL